MVSIADYFTNFKEWFTLAGAVVAFILAFLQIRALILKRVSLNIKLKQKKFVSEYREDGYHNNSTYIKIEADIQNKGLESTTLSGVRFFSDNNQLNDEEMEREPVWGGGRYAEFNERIDSKDRKVIMISLEKQDLLLDDSVSELNATLVFKMGHKDISKKIRLYKR